jgi:hypothetical protein
VAHGAIGAYHAVWIGCARRNTFERTERRIGCRQQLTADEAEILRPLRAIELFAAGAQRCFEAVECGGNSRQMRRMQMASRKRQRFERRQ